MGLPLLALAGYLFLSNRQNGIVEDASDPAETATLQQVASDGSTMKLDRDQVESQQKEIQNLLDPMKDDWETEDFAEKAGSQLKRIAKMMAHAHDVKETDFEGLLSEGFQCEPLRPHSTEEVYNDGAIVVRRFLEAGVLNEAAAAHSGVAGLREAIAELTEGLQNATNVHAKFKLFRVNPAADGIETTQYFQMSGQLENTALARNATWYCRWTLADKGATPKLTSIRVSDYEEVETHGASQTIFSDWTEGVLGKMKTYQENLRYGTDHWIQYLEKRLGTIGFGHTGLAIADVNGDELADVYLCQPGGLPNCLLIQQPDGTVKDRAAQSGVDILDYARSALFADFDNDGDQDLIVSLSHLILIHANDGQGQFTLVTKLPTGGPGYSIAATDYDNDGNLDFYVCSQNIPMADVTDLTIPIPYYDANNGGENALYRNEGKLAFREVTEEVGLNHNNKRFSFAATWEDYDNDGDEDLYVANDFGRNNLYRNDDGHFTDVAASAGVEDIASGMSVTWGDADHDGLMDLYVSNMFSAAGQRTTFQKQYRKEVKEDALPKIQRLARGNTLFMNQGDGTFRDVSLQAGVTLGRWAWGSLFVDINNDSWSDLVVTNGFMSKGNTGDL